MAKRAQPFRHRWEQAFRDTDDLDPTSRLVGLMLATYANSDGANARPGQARLATTTGLADRTVRKHLALLIEAKWIEAQSRKPVDNPRRGGIATTYQLTIPDPTYRHPGAGRSSVDKPTW